jgi:hypothetical protein
VASPLSEFGFLLPGHIPRTPFHRSWLLLVYNRNANRHVDMQAELELTPLTRVAVQCANGTSKSERHFLDFVVNGQSLWEAVGKRHDTVSVLCAEYSAKETLKAVNRLLLEENADLPNERRSLFVCSECGDLGCGAITAVVSKRDKTITWGNFGYENTYEDKVGLDDYSAVGPFTFNLAAYESTLHQALDRLKSLKK